MDSSENEERSLTDRYKITTEDEDSKHWVRLLDFESPVHVESDWYSTETFQVFLDALDINQPTSLGRDSSISNLKSAPSDGQKDTHNASFSSSTNDKSPESRYNSGKKTTQPQQKQNFETILSAEALKILSELPDLSHMSATRSFIFPSNSMSSTKMINKR